MISITQVPKIKVPKEVYAQLEAEFKIPAQELEQLIGNYFEGLHSELNEFPLKLRTPFQYFFLRPIFKPELRKLLNTRTLASKHKFFTLLNNQERVMSNPPLVLKQAFYNNKFSYDDTDSKFNRGIEPKDYP